MKNPLPLIFATAAVVTAVLLWTLREISGGFVVNQSFLILTLAACLLVAGVAAVSLWLIRRTALHQMQHARQVIEAETSDHLRANFHSLTHHR